MADQPHRAGDASEAIKVAWQHGSAGRWQDAITICRQVLGADPDNEHALYLLAIAALRSHRYGDAADLATRAIHRNPNAPDYHRLQSVAFKHLGRRKEAAEAWAKVASLLPKNSQVQLDLGLAWHEQGDLNLAEAAYRQAIALKPDYAEAYSNLGALLRTKGLLKEAVESCRRATELKANFSGGYNNLGIALQIDKRLDEAAASFRRALEIDPNYAEAHCNLGTVLIEQEKFAEGMACFERAVAMKPNEPELHRNFAIALVKLKRTDEAIERYRMALQLRPNWPATLTDLAALLQLRGRVDEALALCEKALQLDPNNATAWRHIGVIRQKQGLLVESEKALEKAATIDPNSVEIWEELAVTLQRRSLLHRAAAACEKAISLEPTQAEAHRRYASIIGEQGRMDEALVAGRKAVDLDPNDASIGSAYVFLLNYSERHEPEVVVEEHRKWAERHADPLTAAAPKPSNDRNPDRPLRIGYVSNDFRLHSMAFFLDALLAERSRERCFVACYSSTIQKDRVSERCEQLSDLWRIVAGRTDAEVAQQIREDQIDILVDLSLHTGPSPLLFARKPAPLQLCYLGYAGTTGMAAMDYKVTDPFMDPPGNEAFYTEQLLRLPKTYFCYNPLGFAPPMQPLPALTHGGAITFGAFQNIAKISERAVQLWCRVLEAVPRSRLVIKSRGLDDPQTRQRLEASFAKQGVAPARVRLVPSGSMAEYFASLQHIDIALDTMPYNGGTTTCQALWSGVPVITLAGKTAVSRMGVSILNNLGLPELIAATPEGYVEAAVRLAGDLNRLSGLRMGMRERMSASPVMDAKGFAADLENAYRTIWRHWCGK